MKARIWSFFLLTLVVGGVCIRLGIWQLARRDERRRDNARIEFQMQRPPVRLDGSSPPPADLRYRRAVAVGRFDPEHQVVLSTRSFNEQPGVHLVTPLRLEPSGEAILVDRGWVPNEASGPAQLEQFAMDGSVEVAGILLPGQEEPAWALLADPTVVPGGERLTAWRVLNIEGIQVQTPYPLLPVYLAQTEALEGDVAQPRIDPDLDLTEGPHFGYAIQWFAFAAIAFAGGGYWLSRRLRNATNGR